MRRTTAIAAALALAACGGPHGAGRADGGKPSGTTHATRHPTSTTAAAGPTAAERGDGIATAVLDALAGFVRSTPTVNDPPDPDHPDLDRYRTGAVLEAARAAVARARALGIGYRLPPGARYSHVPSVQAVEAERALVRYCIVDDAQQVALADGRVLNGTVATKLFEATLVLVDGGWKVSDNRLVERWEGVAGCAVG